MRNDSRIFIAGRDTLLGAALHRQLGRRGFGALIEDDADLDLTRFDDVDRFFQKHKPQYVFLAGGKAGGISANQRRGADLITNNLRINTNVIEAAHRHDVTKLLYLASSCVYPKLCPQPMKVSDLGSGPLEPTNEAYATAKLAGMAMVRAYRAQHGVDFITAIPANSLGPGDHFDATDSHVVAGLIVRLHQAKLQSQPSVTVWGTGSARREFVYADDLADGCIFLMQKYSSADPINLGGSTDVSIRQLAEMIREIVGYEGSLEFDAKRPDGMPLKALECSPLVSLGWQPTTPLSDAIRSTYADYLSLVHSHAHAAAVE